MPAKSKDQQRAAAIALKAKREGTVDDLPNGAAKNMAKSMSKKELDKLASTKHKGLPEDKPNENRAWAGESLTEVFAEEMLGTDEEGEAITSDKNTNDQIEDAGRDQEDNTGWDSYDDAWDTTVNADAPMAQAGRPMGSNVTGAARVSYESLDRMPAKKLNLKKDEIKCPDCYGTGYKGGHGETMSWRDAPKKCERCDGAGKVKKEVAKEHRRDLNSLDILFEQQNDEYYMGDEYYDLTHSPEDWGDEDHFGAAKSEYEGELRSDMEQSLIEDMVQHLITHYNEHQVPVESWEDEELLGDMTYNYQVDIYDSEDQELAQRAKEVAKERLGLSVATESAQSSGRWKKLAGILKEEPQPIKKKVKASLKEMDDAQLQRYVRRMATHGWEWLDVADKLTDQYGLSLLSVEELKPSFDAATVTQQEAMLGGVSNGGPAPGHRAKMNENSPLEYFDKDQSHRVDVFAARDELAGLAYEIAGDIQGMHLDNSDRRTEKMIQSKMGNMYKFLRKLKNLSN